MDMNDLTNAAIEGAELLAKPLIILGIGLIGFGLLKYSLEPWVIETVCRELIVCD